MTSLRGASQGLVTLTMASSASVTRVNTALSKSSAPAGLAPISSHSALPQTASAGLEMDSLCNCLLSFPEAEDHILVASLVGS